MILNGLLSRFTDGNMTRTPIFENWLDNGTDSPEGADPLLWELGQLRRVVQGAVVQSAKSRNHVATASLVRAGNGLLDLLAKIEKTRGRRGSQEGRYGVHRRPEGH
jgi:hypothetical protein